MRIRFLVTALLLTLALALSSCAGILRVIEDRLPPPHEVQGGFSFDYYAPSARQVTLAGNFNNWGGTEGGGRYDPVIDPMSDPDGDGIWNIVVPLPPGRYQYKFVIDGGLRWEQDPNNPDVAYEGGFENSVVLVPPSINYDPERVTGTTISGAGAALPVAATPATETASESSADAIEVSFELDMPDAGEVSVAGAFNGWDANTDPMVLGDDGLWHATLEIKPGTYEYKFVVDGTWIEDPLNPEFVEDPYGGKNSILTVE